MNIEIERKFLVNDLFPLHEYERSSHFAGETILQGYFKNSNIRVRIINDVKAFLTIKGDRINISRNEFEYEIPVGDACDMFNLFCEKLVSKTRFRPGKKGNIWEVDIFHGDNEGLILVEMELKSEDQEIKEVEKPEWLGKEVTDDERYYNSNLAKNPYENWRETV